MKMTKLSLIAALAVSVAVAGGDIVPTEPTVEAPVTESAFSVSANMAFTSNYVWRGMSQTANSPAIQGGIDLGYGGLYLGTWGSNVEFGSINDESMEFDVYGGYKGEVAGIGYDIGFIQYVYPNNTDALNFTEVYAGLSKSFGDFGVFGKYYFNVDAPTKQYEVNYYELGASYVLPYEITIGATYGDFEDTGSNYSVKLSKTYDKFTFSVAYTDFNAKDGANNSLRGDEDHVVGTISASF